MQVERQRLFHKRALYYSSKAYVEQLASSVDYPELKPVYFIGVLNFNVTDSSSYLSRHLILDAETHERHIRDFEFCFVELPKFVKHESELQSIVDKWIFFLCEQRWGQKDAFLQRSQIDITQVRELLQD